MTDRNKKRPPDKITANDILLPGELLNLFSAGLGQLESCLRPRTPIEEHLTRYIALSAWRVARMVAIEKAVVETQMEQESGPYPVTVGANAWKTLADNSRVLELMGRSETRAFRAFKDAILLLMKIREQLPPETQLPETQLPETRDPA